MSTILFKRSNTAGNDSYTGLLGEITIDTQARKIRIHDGVTQGGHTVANMADLDAVINSIADLDLELLGNIEDVINNLASKDTTITAGDGLVGGGDLSEGRTITLGTPGTITGSSTNSVSAEGHTHQISITKADVGLSNVDNTSDANKPISTATQAALDGKINVTEKGAAGGVVPLNSNQKIDNSYISDSILGQVNYVGVWDASTNTPTLPETPTEKGVYYVVSVGGSFAGLTFEVGDWIISNGEVWEKVDNTDAVSSVAGKTGVVVLDKSDVGLSNVDNTSDVNKPISTATQAALNAKADLNSPALTGTPTAPTPTVEDNSTRIATTEFVHDALGSIVSGVASVSGSGAITVNNSDPANPVVGLNNATTSAAGAMSAADKSKLDGIEAGAQVNTVTSVAGKTGAVTVSKSDVGLSNVQNYATANQSQAVEGSSSTLYITPAGVKAFIEGGEYIIDGGTF